MPPIVEVAWESLCKHGEELCGDWVKVVSTDEDLVVVLSDGLGSGVKANILATLTAEIAADMLEKGASIDEVVETLVETLPECQVRHLAYATFAVMRIHKAREAYLAEYDSPPLILVRGGKVIEPPMRERCIAGRTIREGHFTLHLDDYLVMVSDGYVHAGVGGLYRMGWGWNNIAHRRAAVGGNARRRPPACERAWPHLYEALQRPARRRLDGGRHVGAAPAQGHGSHRTARRSGAGRRSRAQADGGAGRQGHLRRHHRANGVSRARQAPARRVAASKGPGRKLPPMGLLEGVDLVTEGILTLSSAVDRLRDVKTVHDLPNDQDAATRLVRELLYADEVHFIVGDAINPQQLADVVRGVPMREMYLDELIARLRERNKTVTVEHL